MSFAFTEISTGSQAGRSLSTEGIVADVTLEPGKSSFLRHQREIPGFPSPSLHHFEGVPSDSQKLATCSTCLNNSWVVLEAPWLSKRLKERERQDKTSRPREKGGGRGSHSLLDRAEKEIHLRSKGIAPKVDRMCNPVAARKVIKEPRTEHAPMRIWDLGVRSVKKMYGTRMGEPLKVVGLLNPQVMSTKGSPAKIHAQLLLYGHD